MTQHRRVHLPQSAAWRGCPGYAKLLTGIHSAREDAFAFVGHLLKPGGAIAECELPTPAILLEYAGPREQPGRRGSYAERARREHVHILWRYDRAAGEFRELARSHAPLDAWVRDLRAAAIAALSEGAPPPPEFDAVEARVKALLDNELAGLPLRDRPRLLSVLHDQLCVRMTALVDMHAGRPSEHTPTYREEKVF